MGQGEMLTDSIRHSNLPNIAGFLDSTLGRIPRREAAVDTELDILDLAIENGFPVARLWAYALDQHANRERLVLIGHRAAPGIDVSYSVGEIVDLESSHILSHKSNPKDGQPSYWPVVVDYSKPTGEDLALADQLGLFGQRVAEIPVWQHDTLDGILALGLPTGFEPSQSDLSILAAIGRLLGQQVHLDLYAAQDALVDASQESDRSTTMVLLGTLRQATYEVQAAASAIFEWNPVENTLTKVHEYFHPDLGLGDEVQLQLSETYEPGEFLTGKAWLHKEDRHVFSFEGIGGSNPEDISAPSLNWHEELLGTVHSVLYSAMAETEHDGGDARYIMRLLNHVGRPAVPFVKSDRSALDRICWRATQLLDGARSAERLDQIMRLAQTAVRDVSLSLDRFADSIAIEGISSAIVVSWPSDLDAPADLVHVVGEIELRRMLRGDDIAKIGQDQLLAQLAAAEPCRWMSLRGSPLAGALIKAGYRSVLGLPFEAGSIKGIVIVPSPSSCEARTAVTASLPGDSARYLLSCAELLARGLETRRSERMAEGALQALGYLGHEMGTPMVQLGSLAVKATSAAQETAQAVLRQRALLLRHSQDMGTDLTLERPVQIGELIKELRRVEGELEQKSDFLASLLSLAPIVALRTNRTLRVNFEKLDVGEVVKAAVQRTRDDPMLAHRAKDSVVRHPWDIRLPSARVMGYQIIADRFFLTVALASLLRNAVKYSVPRPGERESIVVVTVEPQERWISFKVTNWGIRWVRTPGRWPSSPTSWGYAGGRSWRRSTSTAARWSRTPTGSGRCIRWGWMRPRSCAPPGTTRRSTPPASRKSASKAA